MDQVIDTPPFGTMIQTGMRLWFESGLGFRGLTLRRAMATVFCFTLNGYQTISTLISLGCFCYAYSQLLAMTSTRELLGKMKWMRILGFVVGVIGWRIWMSVLRLLCRWERSLRPYEHAGVGKLILLILRAPGLTLSPILGAYMSPEFTDVAGIHVLCALAACTFFIQLTHPCESDFGSVDMFEGIHLPILPQLHLKFQKIALTSCVYYLRKFVLLGVEEIIKWVKRRQPELQQAVQPEIIIDVDDLQHPPEIIIAVDDLQHPQVNIDVQYLEGLALVTREFLTTARTDGLLLVAINAAFEHGSIDINTKMELLEKIQDMVMEVDGVELHLANLTQVV